MTPRPDPADLPFWGYSDLALFVGMILPSVGIAAILTKGLALLAPVMFARKTVSGLGMQLLFYILFFASLYGLLRLRHARPFWESLGWRYRAPGFWTSFMAGPLLAIFVGFAGVLIKAPTIPMPFDEMLNDKISLALLSFFIVILGPLCEELFFRGFLLPLLARSFGWGVGILITALPFALLHGPQYKWAWQQIFLVYFSGVVFGLVRRSTGSTAASTAIHATYNGIFLALFIYQHYF